LHIPFPERKQLRRIPQSSMIVDGLLGADLIGFHTPSYVTNFLGCASDLNVKTIDPHQISYHNRQIRVAEFPMGIDYAKFTEASKTKDVRQLVHGYKKKYKGLKVIASVDRLDPSKGLVERLNAYRDYLRTYPKKQGKVIFVMVAAPSRTSIDEYQKLSQKLDKLASEINKEFGNEAWQPLEYINQPIPFEKVTALFKVADLAFIMPIKDGMNLAAKEFVASNHKGVLILSETAGAAEELKDALLVNPRNTEQIIKALNKGLNMRRNELQRRINRMRRQLSNNTVHDWAKTFVDTLAQPLPGTPRVTRSLSPRIEAKLVGEYKRASNRLLLLDYDGTLSKLTKDYSLKPSDSIIKLLKDLSKDKRNELVLISGRQKSQLDDWFEGINISLVAEHGATIKKVGGRWKTIDKLNTGWQQKLNTVLNEYVEDTPGSSIEVKPHSLVWHYRAASVYSANKNLVLIKRSLSSQLKKYGLSLMQGNKIIEIKNKDINKGVAAQSWLSGSHDFILTMGDDTTDEDLFNVVPFESATVKVGRGLTKAQYRLPTNKEVVQFLEKLI
jgi:trehalose 6-phosphate synthase/phosphatase